VIALAASEVTASFHLEQQLLDDVTVQSHYVALTGGQCTTTQIRVAIATETTNGIATETKKLDSY
jgi:hypothetical protein